MMLAEAGTGVGKTLGYLAPASLWAEANGTSVWISTYTRALQRQIERESASVYPDPAVRAKKAVVRKGRENYLCLLNFQDVAQAAMLGKDAAAVQKANDAGSQGVAQALTDTGKADQAFLNVSPYLGVLNALTSEAQYKTETGAPPTSITGSKMPAWLAQAYQSTVGASPSGAATVGTTTTPNPSTSATTPSTDTSSVAGGGNG